MSPECDSPIVWHPGTQLMLSQHKQLVRKLALGNYPGQESNLASLICEERALTTTPQGHKEEETFKHSNSFQH